jgi:hypothetical protein
VSDPVLMLEVVVLPNGLLKASVPAHFFAPDAPKWKRDAVAAVKDLVDALAQDPVIAALRDLNGVPTRPQFTQ